MPKFVSKVHSDIDLDAGNLYKINGSSHTHVKADITDLEEQSGLHTHLKSDITDLETITTTPTASAVPKADTSGKIDNGWLNTGSESGLDADKVDGQHASAFATASHTHVGSDITSQVPDSDKLDGQHASDFASASHTHAKSNITDLETITTTPSASAIPKADASGKIDTGWLSTGSGSGFDADKLDGLHASAFAAASHDHTKSDITDLETITITPAASAIPKADASGKISSGWLSTGSGSGLDADKVDGKEASDFALASHTHSGTDITSQVSDSDKLDGQHASAFALASHTHAGADITSQVADSDKLDGQHASDFAAASHTHSGTDIISQVSDSDKLDGQHASAFALSSHTHTKSNITDLETITTTPSASAVPKADASGKIDTGWLETGAGSGLDADKLDGQHASDFAPVSHTHSKSNITDLETITTTPAASAVPKADNTGKIDTGWLNTGPGSEFDADTLDSKHASDFALASHTHSGTDITSQVADADKLDGQHASDFASVSHTHTKSNIIDLETITNTPSALAVPKADVTGKIDSNWLKAGSGSGIDADKVDGKDASDFASASHTHAGADITSQVSDSDKLDGQHASDFASASHAHTKSNITDLEIITTAPTASAVPKADTSGKLDNGWLKTGSGSGLNADQVDGYDAGNSSGQIPISNGTVCTSLNADKVDGYDASAFATSSHTHTKSNITDLETITTTPTISAIPKADASGKLDNNWLKTGHGNGLDADTIDGLHASELGGAAQNFDPVYVKIATPDTITAVHTFNPTSTSAPFILGANARGQLVTGLNADKVDGYDASSFATSSHTHTKSNITDLETITATPAASAIPKANTSGKIDNGWLNTGSGNGLDADKLDGQHASAFAAASHTHAGTDITSQVSDSDKLDGQHASAFAAASHTHTKSNITDLETITVTATASAVPKADASGKIDNAWLKTGSGNGLDADTVDGSHASAFASASHNHDATYVKIASANTITAVHTFNPGTAGAPFILGANASGQLVTGLNADKVDGYDASSFATSSHTHTKSNITDLETITATPTASTVPKANASGKLDNGWLNTGSGNGLDADTVDGSHASAFATASHNHDATYVKIASANTITAVHTFNPASAGAPFTLGANASGQLVTGLNADKVDGYDASSFATSSHTHTKSNITDLEAITTTPTASTVPKADASGKLDNGWLKTGSGNGLDADTVDGSHASAFATASHNHDATYVKIASANTITAVHTFNPASAGAPFTLGTNASGQLVTGLNADKVDGYDASSFAASSHTHTKSNITDLETITTTPTASAIPKANTSGKLDNGWLNTGSGSGLNADQVDGYHLNQDVQTTASPSFVKMTLTQATGAAPLTVSSTTVVTNLNADKVDGYDAGNSSGQIPISNGTVCTNLNADTVDGSHASAFAAASHTHTKANITDLETITATPTASAILKADSSGKIDNGWLKTGSGNGLNADQVDGYHLNQDVQTTASPSFTKVTLTQATGSAPLTVSSTTVVTNLNADKVDGYDAGNSSGQIALSNGTVCTNLNADTVDGSHASAFAAASHNHDSAYVKIATADTITAVHTFNPSTAGAPFALGANASGRLVTGLNADKVDGYDAGNSSGQIPISNGTVCTNLNADTVDGSHASAFAAASHTHTKANITDLETITTTPTASTVPKADASGKIDNGWLKTGSGNGLNADQVDGYHLNQDVQTTASPSFVKITLTQATGTAPLTVSSTTVVTNLNADKVDGYDAGNSSGQIALSNGTLCTNLNADKVDGYDASSFLLLSGGAPSGTVNFDTNSTARLVIPVGTDQYA